MPRLPLSAAAAVVLATAAAVNAQGATVSATLGGVVSLPVPQNAVGFSYEVGCIPGMFGNATQGPRKSFANVLNVLRNATGGTTGPEIRIGGNSADTSAYVPGNGPLPPNVTYRITDADFAAYAAAVPLWNGTITPGLNFDAAHDSSLAVRHLSALLETVPAKLVAGFEVGNEVDLFPENGFRTPNWSYEDYASEWKAYTAALQTLEAKLPSGVVGGTFCCNHSGFDLVTPALLPLSARWSEHFYPLSVCNHKTVNTVWDLLADTSAAREAWKEAGLAALAQQLKVPFMLGEMNSISCGGQYGVSDTFAAALWAVDAMFNAVAVNITGGFRFHGCAGGAYTAIAYNNTSDINNAPDVRPLFYGMWAFATASGHNAQLLDTASTFKSSDGLIKLWALRSEEAGETRVVVIHKDGNATAPAAVTLNASGSAAAGTTATLTVLAPSSDGVYAKNGLSFGGLTFDGSADGLPLGTPSSTPVTLGADGTFSFQVQPASIALLTFPSSA